MSTTYSTATTLHRPDTNSAFDEAELAAAAFLARYSGRTLDAYRHDLRAFFQWSADVGLTVPAATRPQIQLYRVSMEERGLAASTIDRRLSTVCGYYRFAHIDGRIASNPAQYVRRPKVQPSEGHGMDRGELGTFLFTAERLDRAHAALAVLLGLNGLRVSEACGTNIEDLGCERLAPSTWRSASATRGPSSGDTTGSDSIDAPLTGECVRSGNEPASVLCTRTCCAPASSWRPWTRACRCATCRSRPGTLIPERRPSMTVVGRTSTPRRLRGGGIRRRRLKPSAVRD